ADKLGDLLRNPNLVDSRSVFARLSSANVSGPALGAISDARAKAGFSFPAWDNPSQLFGLLIGKDVTLARFDSGNLSIGREFQFLGQLTVGVGAGVPGFNVRVEGGVNGVANVDLRDPNNDGKIRFAELVNELSMNPNPICLFQVGARVSAFIQVVLDATL